MTEPPNHKGWTIHFLKNVHMYCHSLKAEKRGRQYEVPCEDSPMGFVGIWPYELKLDDKNYQELIEALLDWADSLGLKYRIYKTRDEYITNVGS